MECEFEEKEYEGPLNHELLLGDPRIWSPGQVFEKHMGLDSALFVWSQLFWESLGYKHPLLGVVVNDLRFGHIWRRTNRKRMLPSFATNLFLQVKRSECMIRSNYKIPLYSPYYRFSIKPHQQLALAKLSRKLNHRGLVMYAAPVFHTHEELYEAVRSRSLVANTNFANIDRLNGHDRWNYQRAGCSGVAHSEPERIEMPAFQEQLTGLEAMSIEFDNRRRNTLEEDLVFVFKAMRASALETQDESPISREYLRHVVDAADGGELRRSAVLFANILLYCWLFGLHWHVVSSEDANYF